MSELPPVPSAGQMIPPTMRFAAPVQPVVPSWPLVIGIICIVLGIGGVVVGLIGVVSYAVFSSFLQQMQPGVVLPAELRLGMILSSAASMAVSVLLIVVGIGMTKRRRWSLTLAWAWALLRMVFGVVGVVLGVIVQSKQFAGMSSQGVMPPGMGGFTNVIAVTSMLFGVAWAWALPVFVLVWLGRAKIRQQTQEWA